MLTGETTKRSALDADQLVAKLQAHGVERLRGEADLWVIVDGSDLRKPHAETMAYLQRVKRLSGGGTVNGYRTLNVLGVGAGGRRGLLYHHLFSSHAPDFVSEPAETRTALRAVGTALTPLAADGAQITAILDSGFDDAAIWGEVWGQDWHLVCRLFHRDRWVERRDGTRCQLAALAADFQARARAEAEFVVRKVGQARPKLQPVSATIRSVPCQVRWQRGLRTGEAETEQTRACWLVEVCLERVACEPWWLLTDQPVETEAQALRIFRMYCQRWAIEDVFKVGKTCLGWEAVQVQEFEAIRLLVALGWVAAGFLYDLGVTLEWGEVRLLRRLGGGEERANRPPGKLVLMRGLRRLLDGLALAAILAAEEREHGLPPRIAALLGRSPP
jgi:hypothetical protein